MLDLVANLINFLINIRRILIFPWSVLGYSIRTKPRFKSKLAFLKTFYYVLFYIKHIILTILLWPYFIRKFKCSENVQDFFNKLFWIACIFWCLGLFLAYAIMILTKWFEIFVFFPLMRIIFFILFEVKYRRNKKLLFKESTKQELLDFEGDNMHKSEKSLLTYKLSYQYVSTYKKFTIPLYCSSPAIDLNYKVFNIDIINNYKKAKEKLIAVLGDDFFVFLEELNIYLTKRSQVYYDDYYFKDAISIVYTLIKRLDYNYLFLYFIPYLFGHIARYKISSDLLEKVNKLMRSYLDQDVYVIKPIFKRETTLEIYQRYVVDKDDQIKKSFLLRFFTTNYYFQI